MTLELLVMISLVVMGVYLLVMEHLIKKQKKRLEQDGTIQLKEVGEDE